jgi:hypothetical protein
MRNAIVVAVLLVIAGSVAACGIIPTPNPWVPSGMTQPPSSGAQHGSERYWCLDANKRQFPQCGDN